MSIELNYINCPILVKLIENAVALQDFANRCSNSVDIAMSTEESEDAFLIQLERENQARISLTSIHLNIKSVVNQCRQEPICQRCSLTEHIKNHLSQ